MVASSRNQRRWHYCHAAIDRYLASVFPERRVFRYRDFERFEDVAEEFDKAQIAFLLSCQLPRLPPKSTDLVLNISSLHEMRPE